jgi:branched-subunit amino acid transport protein
MSNFEMLMVAGMMLITFCVRYPVLALVSKVTLPPPVLEALKFIPPAVLTAIIAPAVLQPAGSLDLSLSNAYLIAAIAAALIAWRTKNLLLTIVLGMVIFLGWRWPW